MKRFICAVLCLILVLSLCGCSKEKENNESGIDLSYYALLGKIPEVEYSLGADPDVITKKLNERLEKENAAHEDDPNDTHGHEEDQFYFEVVQGDKNVMLDNGHICYYYRKDKKSDGISYIVNYDTAYGFELGTLVSEIKEALSGIEFFEEPVASHNAFFAEHILNGSVLSAGFNDVVISFVFQDSALFATVIRNSHWSY